MKKISIQQRVKDDLTKAIKAGDTQLKNLLRVLIGEFNRVGKEVSDDEAMAAFKKMVKNAEDMKNDFEVKTLFEYLPKQLTVDQIDSTPEYLK